MHLFTDRACEVAFFCRFCCLFRHRKTIHEKPIFRAPIPLKEKPPASEDERGFRGGG